MGPIMGPSSPGPHTVLLGPVLVAVWERWEAADATTADEANELAGIFWFAHSLPQPERRHVQELVRSYERVVVEEEWPLMVKGSLQEFREARKSCTFSGAPKTAPSG
jgi:hypothetical protein